MTGYTGKFECKVDAKGRMKLPAGLLRQLPEDYSGKFIINKGLDNNLDLYTEDEWKETTQKLKALNRFNSRHRQFLRAFSTNASIVEMDSSDRILIPKNASELIQMGKEAVIQCYGSTIEIWAKEVYDSEIKDIENFSDLADSIFGNPNIEL